MLVTVKQRGGFAGMEVGLAQVDTSTLDAATRAAIERHVRTVLSSASGRDAQVGADQLEYELTVDDGGSRKTMTWIEDGTDNASPIRELVARLVEVM